MIIGVLSDVHGNFQALKAVLQDGKNAGVDKWFCLGDIAFKGPEPEESIGALMELGEDVAIMGNTEEWLSSGPPESEGSTPEAKIYLRNWWEWMIKRLSKEQIDWVDRLPHSREVTIGNERLLLTHATTRGIEDTVLSSAPEPELQDAFRTANYSLVLCGHIHVPYLRRLKKCTVLNTGSTGRPVDGEPRPSYVLLNISEHNTGIQFRRVAYDIERVCKTAVDRDFPKSDAFISAISRGASF